MAEPKTPKWTHLQEGQRGPKIPIPAWVPTTTQPVSAVPPSPTENANKREQE